MARESRRAQLEIYNVMGMCRQALISFKASFILLLTLALVSSVYETAVERSALLSGISFSAQSSNFSFQFSFDPKQQPERASNDDLKNDAMKHSVMPYEGDSLLSRILALFLPEDHKSAEMVSSLGTEGLTSDRSDVTSTDNTGNVETDSNNFPAPDVMDVPESVSAGYDSLGEVTTSSSADELVLPVETGDGETANKMQAQRVEIGDEESVSEEVFEKFEHEADDDSNLPRLVIETVSNETKKPIKDILVETMDLTFFTGKLLGGRGLDQGAMPHGGLTVLLMFLVVAIAMIIFLAIVGFQHAAVIGSVAYSIATTHMGKRASIKRALKAGFRAGVARLMWLAILHATLRGLQSLFFMKTLFGGVMEMEQVEQLIVRLSATPFAFLAPFMDVDATSISMALRIGLFVGLDYIFDGIAYCLYVVACWVTIMEREYWGLRALSRSWNLIKCMDMQAFIVRLLEAVVCGRSSRWLLQRAIGQFPAAFLISVAQFYFLVLWLIFYMSARSLHDGPAHFSYRTLEDFLDKFK